MCKFVHIYRYIECITDPFEKGGKTGKIVELVHLKIYPFTVELQWLEHWWLVHQGCLELVLGSLGKNPIAADLE